MFGFDDVAIVGAMAISAAANAYSQHKANKANKSIANMNNETAIELANTAHQREVQDLQEAGLNPILSAGGTGAAVPQLATSHLEAPQIDMNGIISAVNAMTEYQKGQAYSANLNANTKKTNIEAEIAPKIAEAQIALSNAQGNLAQQKAIREKLESDIAEIQKKYYKETGTAPNMSHLTREAKGLYNLGKKGGYNAYQALYQIGNEIKDSWENAGKYKYLSEHWDYKTQSFKRN